MSADGFEAVRALTHLTPTHLPERHPGNVPEFGAGSYGELDRHREARAEWRTRITEAAAPIHEFFDTAQSLEDPETRAELKKLLDTLEAYRPTLERDATPFTLDHADA